MELMHSMPHILGNADPLRYMRMLPGVGINSELDAGIHIQGCDDEHNYCGINGVPIYNVNHLLGIFSAFNPSHFSKIELSKSWHNTSLPNRLGGQVDIVGFNEPQSFGGELSIGPMSTQGTIKLPIDTTSTLILSGRFAYLNLLYSRWLKFGDDKIKYSFSDYNLTYIKKFSNRSKIWVDAYLGNDDATYSTSYYDLNFRAKWSNILASVNWQLQAADQYFLQTAYFTRYENTMRFYQPNIDISAPSSIYDLGYKIKNVHEHFSVGADFTYHNADVIMPTLGGELLDSSYSGDKHTFESSVYGEFMHAAGSNVDLTYALKLSNFIADDDTFWGIDPEISLLWKLSSQSKLDFILSTRHQNLFKVGFSDVGLPSEFWMPASAKYHPQYSYNASAVFETFFRDRHYRLSAEIYYKRLYKQVEYVGNVFDFIYKTYNLDKSLISGDGHNYGVALTLEKRKGRLTGWLSLSLGRSLRHFEELDEAGYYPSNHERLFDVSAVASYKFNEHFDFGVTFICASGTPFTPAKRMYLLNNNIIMEFGKHNEMRTPAYLRADLSVNYNIKHSGKNRSGINFSLYNFTCVSNQVMYAFEYYRAENSFEYRPTGFKFRLLPSISYFINF